MPAKVKVKILACRNLPVMDRSNDTTDAFVEVKLGNSTFKTEVRRKTLNPVFNSNWFRFEIDDAELQDEAMIIRVMDFDTYSANDPIGKVSLSLSPLVLQRDQRGMNGWIPIYDTMNGIRGEINFVVKVELFSDSNKFRQSSCGIQFFHSTCIPHGHNAIIRGFVEELVFEDDPEHDWIDKIRRAASSNEARQIAFMKLTGQIQRKIGLKAIATGGNAVVGFRLHFDLEKETIIARGIGTCVTLIKVQTDTTANNNIPEDEVKTDFACKAADGAYLARKCELETGVKPKRPGAGFPLAKRSQSLLDVPQISVSDASTPSMPSYVSSNTDDREESVNEIVRNIEVWEENRRRESEDSVQLEEVQLPRPEEGNKRTGKRHIMQSIQEKIQKMRLQSPPKDHKMFHDLKENVTGKFHQIAGKFHLPLSSQQRVPQGGLLNQAMETMLMEKFTIAEASVSVPEAATPRRKSSTASLQSIKRKFNLFSRSRRSIEGQNDASDLNSISEVTLPLSSPESDTSSLVELNIHEEQECSASNSSSTFTTTSSAVTVIENKPISRDDLRVSVDNFDSVLATHPKSVVTANTNKNPLHGSLLSLSRNELSNSPAGNIHARTESIGSKFPASPAKNVSSSLGKDQITTGIHRRSSDSDLSVTPKGNSLTPGYDRNVRVPSAVVKPLNQERMDMLEYPFLTLTKYPNGFIHHLGATVSARSVKLLEKGAEKDENETRDGWFNEVRMEIRGHAKSLGCNVILGYSESTTIKDDVTVLSATGTAAVINLQYASELAHPKDQLSSSVDETIPTHDDNPSKIVISVDDKNGDDNDGAGVASGGNLIHSHGSCVTCHIPYSRKSSPNATFYKCSQCRRGWVPDIILATIELPDDLQVVGNGTLIQACVCRPKRDLKSENNAKEISDGLPFLEYELHRLLINKLLMKGMNAIFRLSVQVTVGDKMIALIATGTAVYLSALQATVIPKIVPGQSWNDSPEKLMDMQRKIQSTVEKNREKHKLNFPELDIRNINRNFSDNDDSDNEEKLDYTVGNKQPCLLEIDDIQDLDSFPMLLEQFSHDGIKIVNAQSVPGHDSNLESMKNLQMFTNIWRSKIAATHQTHYNFSKQFDRLLQSIFYKLRRAVPCIICDIEFQLDLPTDEIQLLITGMVLKTTKVKSRLVQSLSHEKRMEDELMFSLEEEDTVNETSGQPNQFKLQKRNSGHSIGSKTPSNDNDKFVDITPLSWVPGGKIEKYLGNLNFSFIRETTNVREHNGICGFVHSFITELLAIVRAHISALGGNMMVAFYMTELVLIDNPHKNQAQCLIQVGGDAVLCSQSDDN